MTMARAITQARAHVLMDTLELLAMCCAQPTLLVLIVLIPMDVHGALIMLCVEIARILSNIVVITSMIRHIVPHVLRKQIALLV